MPDYKAMYFALASQVANAIDVLLQAQQDGEESAMKEDCILELLPERKQTKPPQNKT